MKNITMIVMTVALFAGVGNAIELEGVDAKGAAALAQELSATAEVPAAVPVDRVPKASHIWKAVSFKSPAFAELLVNSLKVKPELVVMAGGQSYVYKVGNGLVCYKSFATDIQLPNVPRKASYSCSILPEGGWKLIRIGAYGAADNRDFSLALYEALNVKAVSGVGMNTKTLELGGDEINQLFCMSPRPEGVAMGFRPYCEFINAL
ncbi:MAG: hypothetical protein Q8O90_08645 [Elusimicrobiota bacterium]|nr:hypothetical protein [Elusimicrobiota bacterium]